MTHPPHASGTSPLDGNDDWRILGGLSSAWFDAPTHAAGAALVARIAGLTQDGTLPDIDLRSTGLRIRIAAGAPTDAAGSDRALVDAISAAAKDLGLTADPGALQSVGVVIEAADVPSVMGFWDPVLSYQRSGAGTLTDPLRRDPAVIIDRLTDQRPLRNRIHLDVVRPTESVGQIRTTLGAEPYGPYGLTLADAEGNEVDLVPGDPLPGGDATADWRTVFSAMARYPTASAERACSFAAAVAELADAAGVPLLVDLRPGVVVLDSGKDGWEDDGHGSAGRFADLAGRVQQVAREQGLTADPGALRFVQFGIDTVDVAVAQEFWTALLGYQRDQRQGVTDIYDPRRLNPEIFFQDLDADQERRAQRNRIRLVLTVPSDQVAARIDAAVAAGGRVLAEWAADRCVVTDPGGNEIEIVGH